MTRPFEDRLRDELMSATRRQPRRHRTLAVTAAALAVAGLLTASFVADSRPAGADVEITHDAGRVTVRLAGLTNTAEDVEAATAAEGLDIRVKAVAAGPSQVGRFVGELSTSEAVVDVERSEVDGVTFMAFSIPEDWDGTLTVLLGRTARPDEAYQSSTDALAPGEPLACSNALGMPLESVVPLLSGFDVAVLIFENGQALPQMTLPQAIAAGYGNEPISGANGLSSTKVIIDVGRSLPPQAPRPC